MSSPHDPTARLAEIHRFY